MAEEKFDENTTDDQTVLTILLRTVRGIGIVSTPPLAEVEVGADDDSDF
ncbi:MAG TPA: hypothetical protein VFQ70_02385 [Candidatus Saccharimonadaceae bacterium]|nr:hypothetical protein [Candidatus Saccharimonadaceae bacterium]